MSTDILNAPVLVTGGSGFVASHLVKQLLERGCEVRASVRDLGRADKVGPLRELASKTPRSQSPLPDRRARTRPVAGAVTVTVCVPAAPPTYLA